MKRVHRPWPPFCARCGAKLNEKRAKPYGAGWIGGACLTNLGRPLRPSYPKPPEKEPAP